MKLKEAEINLLNNRKEFCIKAMSNYNRKLPNKLLIALGLGLLYSFVRTKINSEEKISFFTTLMLIVVFFNAVIIIEHIRLLRRIKKDLKEVLKQIEEIKSNP